jgi:uncharacterized RDD family membrane protein YckC
MPLSTLGHTFGGQMLVHTRSLRRRFGAFIIDSILMAALAFAVLGPIAHYSGRTILSGISFFHYTSCASGTALDRDGTPLSTAGWQNLVICDSFSDFIFHRRTANFLRQSQSVSSSGTKTTYNETVTLDIDNNNRVTAPIDLSAVSWLIFISLLAFLEHRYLATPGKRIFRLEVINTAGDAPTFKQAIVRNALKFLPVVLLVVLPGLLAFVGFGTSLDPALNITPDHRVVFPQWFWSNFKFFIGMGLFAAFISLIIVLSIFLPWSKAGRGIYDRLARTQVIG